MLRSNAKVRVIEVLPCPLEELMESIPAIVENWRSSGVATAEAMVSGVAPGSAALTWMVGKSTLGSAATGKMRYPTIPNIRMADMTRTVIIGRSMKMRDMFIHGLARYAGS